MGLTKDYLKFVHSGTCNLIGSPDGAVRCVDNLTCAAMAAESIFFYNMRTLEKTFEIRSETNIVTVFELSPNKEMVAIGYNNGEIHLHKRNSESTKIVFKGHKTGVNSIAFSNDGFILASGGKDSVIALWDLLNESGICRLFGHKGSITHLQFTQNDQFLLSSSKDSHIRFWGMQNKSCFYTLAESTTEIYSFALINSDRLLIIGNAEIELLICELQWEGNLSHLFTFDDETRPKIPRNEEINENEGMNEQANKILKSIKRGTLIRQAKGRALQIIVSKDESIICCIGSDSLIDVYRHFTEQESKKRYNKKLRKMRQKLEIQEKAMLLRLEEEVNNDITTLITRIGDFRAESKIKSIDFCDPFNSKEDGNVKEFRLFCLLKTNDIQGISMKIDWKSNAIESLKLASLGTRVHRTDVRTLSFSGNGRFFGSGSQESALIWDVATSMPLNKYTAENLNLISASLITPDDKQFILGTKNGILFQFDIQKCELNEKYENVHNGAISQLCLYPQKDGFISCGQDKKCKFWKFEMTNENQRTKFISKRVLELPDEALCASISPNNKFVVFGLLDNTARVYYMDTLKFFVSLYGHSLAIYSVDISLDSKLVITGSADKSIRIWGLDFGDCHKSIFAHDDTVNCVKFSRNKDDENLFWSAGKDGKIKQWDAIKFNHIQTLQGHTDQIDSIILNSDGNLLISASHDKSIRVWELTEEIIVLQEEEEKLREKDFEEKLIEEEDILPGEDKEPTGDLAALKSVETIKSIESIIESIEIIRSERIEKSNPLHKRHILLSGYPANSEHFFLMDTLQKIRFSNMEKSLLALPFGYIPELLEGMCECIKNSYKPEIASKVINFIMRIHHNEIIHSTELLSIVHELRMLLPEQINSSLSRTGYNIAALKLILMKMEKQQNTKIFALNLVEEKRRKKKKKSSNKRTD